MTGGTMFKGGYWCSVAAGLVASLSLASSATADDITIPPNRSTQLTTFGTANKQCYNTGKPISRVAIAPKHGKVRFDWISTTYGAWAIGCHNKPTKMISIVYTPDKGYHGRDYLKVSFSYYVLPGSNETAYSAKDFEIEVR